MVSNTIFFSVGHLQSDCWSILFVCVCVPMLVYLKVFGLFEDCYGRQSRDIFSICSFVRFLWPAVVALIINGSQSVAFDGPFIFG